MSTSARVVYAIPSANASQASDTLAKWKAWGYRTAVLLNGPSEKETCSRADVVFRERDYRGWGASINHLCELLEYSFDWLATGGDDMMPPERHAQEIASECALEFDGCFGVMQATGDRWLNNSDRICGSPWIGRDFALAWNGGRGPFWPDYHHHFADNELHDTAQMHDLLWNRRDLSVLHLHWRRDECARQMPSYMRIPYGRHDSDAALYRARRSKGFPDHEPAAAREAARA